MADNLARALPRPPVQELLVSVKQLFGVTCFIGVAVLGVFLFWNLQPVRTTLKKMPYWNVLGRATRRALNHSYRLRKKGK